MPNFNQIILIGHLTRDPQLRQLNSGGTVTDFGLAVNHKFRTKGGEDREEVCFIDCSAFGRTGEVINEHCRKGKAIMVCGRLKYDTWEDKQGAGKRSKHSVMVETFQFMGDGQRVDRSSSQERPSRPPQRDAGDAAGYVPNEAADDLPF